VTWKINLYVSKLEYVYIFHRNRNGLNQLDLNGIKQRLIAQGIDVSNIKEVPQDGCDEWLYSTGKILIR